MCAIIQYLIISLLITISSQEAVSGNGQKTAAKNMQGTCKTCHQDVGIKKLNEEYAKKSKRVVIWFAMRTENMTNDTACEIADSSSDFPNLFTPEDREAGAIVVHFLVGIYCFILIALICDNYFIPCVEKICDALSLSEDVAAATFMSMATSAPELFVNIIGTFITKSDIGIGTIVGSSMFNTLGVASVGGLAASVPIRLLWWPLCRDIILYILAIIFLVLITWDGRIYWYEAFCLFCGYFIYFLVMFQNNRISRCVYFIVNKYRKKDATIANGNVKLSVISTVDLEEPRKKYVESYNEDIEELRSAVEENIEEEEELNVFKIPKGKWYKKAFFFFTWPLRFAMYLTIPDCKKYPKLFPITFVMCVVWIGCNSYIVSWMITMIGTTFEIPDAVLGLTFLAAGGCLPEAFSIGIMSRKGQGKLGISNALGSNTMNILLSLGLPWFIKTLILGTDQDDFIDIQSGSLEYTILGLIAVAITLFTILALNKFTLSKKTGVITITCYFCFLALAIVSETVIFGADC